MGFGFVFVGYLMMFCFPYKGFDFFPDVLGYALMLVGMWKLAQYNKNFLWAKRILVVLTGIGTITLGVQILGLLDIKWDILIQLLNSITILVLFVYHYFLLFGLRDIAKQTQIKKIEIKAVRNWILTLVYYGLQLFMMVPIPAIQKIVPYFVKPVFLFGYLWIILNLILIFSCYMWICLEGDEDMPEKPKKAKKSSKREDEL